MSKWWQRFRRGYCTADMAVLRLKISSGVSAKAPRNRWEENALCAIGRDEIVRLCTHGEYQSEVELRKALSNG